MKRIFVMLAISLLVAGGGSAFALRGAQRHKRAGTGVGSRAHA